MMKKFFLIVYLLAAFITLRGQVTPPQVYNSNIKTSYVRSWDATKPALDATSITTQNSRDVKQSTQYLDALARPLQAVVKQGSYPTNGSATDLVTANVYDEFGREIYKYLPFSSTANDGTFKLNPFQQQVSFYNSLLNGQAGETNLGESSLNWAYGQTVFEISPLDRPVKLMSPGSSWVGSSRGVASKYWANTTTDDVRKWTVTNVTNGWGTLSTSSSYAAGELYKNISEDENGKQVIEFKDKDGQTILKKVQLTAMADDGTGKNYSGWLCTYYIYDNLGNLRCVIQPRGVELLIGSWSLTTTLLDEQCFRYEYDGRNRMIRKKVPGAGQVYMIYDRRDRLIMTQDSNLRLSNKWLVTKYDALNRAVITGFFTDATHTSLASMIQYVKDTEGQFTLFEVRDPANFLGYTFSNSFPTMNSNDWLTLNFYDDYNWAGWFGSYGSRNTSMDSYFDAPSNNYPYPQSLQQSNNIRGLSTGSIIKKLGTSDGILTVNYYDEKGRIIQTMTTEYLNKLEYVTTQYGFDGRVLMTVHKQEKHGSNPQTIIIVTKNSYDDLGRIIQVEKKHSNTNVNNNAMSAYSIISTMEYDALGQLKNKKIGSKKDPATGNYYNPRQPLEELVSDYNIRGWMLGVNRDYLISTGQSGSTKFGFELNYDKAATKASRNISSALQFNGNISGMTWKSDGDDVRRKYDFSYDAANRLLQGAFEQEDGINSWNSTTMSYKVMMGDGSSATSAYDENGNIKAMTQYGWKLGVSSSTPIDNLTYTMETNSNKLKQVTDANNDNSSTLGDFKYDPTTKTSTDYSYDGNGNLVLDNNKKISSITYNHLNLPVAITVTGKGDVNYAYDASGTKLKKTTNESSASVPFNGTNYTTNITTTTTYISGAVYESKTYSNSALSSLNYTNRLQFISHEEGRMRFKQSDSTLHYDYFIKDHLGNVRMVLTEEVKSDMYPAATMETSASSTEEKFYSNLPSTRSDAPSGYPAGAQKVAKVRGDGSKIGPAIILKVMAGDKINLIANSYWAGGTPNSPQSPLNDLISALSGNVASVSGGKASSNDLTNSGLSSNAATGFLNNQSYTSGKPKAYINWILLDEQFKAVITNDGKNSGFEQVQASGNIYQHSRSGWELTKNGYLYIYVSNETPNIDVFFDNLQVSHVRGPILDETHYYPFGLIQAGISSKALNFGETENKKKYNGIEKENDLQIEVYDAQFRELDGQTGVWWQIDPKIENMEMWSPYASNFDNPLRYSDPLGDEGQECCKWLRDVWSEVKDRFLNTVDGVATLAKDTWKQAGENFENRVNERATIFHQLVDNPLETMAPMPVGGGRGFLLNAFRTEAPLISGELRLVRVETNLIKSEVNVIRAKSNAVKAGGEGGSIYKVPGERTPSGKPYVGRTKHPDPAKRRASDGRIRQTKDKIDSYDPKKVQEGRVKEQNEIEKEGLENLDNKRNEIRPKKGRN